MATAAPVLIVCNLTFYLIFGAHLNLVYRVVQDLLVLFLLYHCARTGLLFE